MALAPAPLDVIIIGAGLAGLSAAHALAQAPGRRTLVLEREDRAGGRILTRHPEGVACDLGAIFGFNAALLPTRASLTTPILEDGPIGILHEGRLVLDGNVPACLRALDPSGGERAALVAWVRQGFRGFEALPKRLKTLLSAFFHVIHPGEMERYVPDRHADALVRFETHHRAEGNGEVIRLLASPLEQDGRLLLGARVESIRPGDGTVEVALRTSTGDRRLTARTVICTAPAPEARALLPTEVIRPAARRFLQSVEFAEGTVVALGLPARPVSTCTGPSAQADARPVSTCTGPSAQADARPASTRTGPCDPPDALPAFSYVVTPDLASSMILQQGIPGTPDRLFFVYYTGAASRRLSTLPDTDVVAQATRDLCALATAAGLPALPAPRFTEVAHWPHLGPVISPEAYDAFTAEALEPCERVHLAGDYTCPAAGMPYGLEAAVRSGQQAAARVEAHLHADGTR